MEVLDDFFCYLGRSIKNDLRTTERDYKKILRVIKSCNCKEHLDVAKKLITLFHVKHKTIFLLKKLEKRFWFKKKLIEKI